MKLYLEDWVRNKIRKPVIRHLEILPLWKCNARCPTCGSYKRDGNIQLSWEQANSIIQCDKFRHLDKIVIEGGEPTLWEPLPIFIEESIKKWTQLKEIVIITNGLRVDLIACISERLIKCKPTLRWSVSLNGMGKNHDESRGIEGAFQRTIASIGYLINRGYEVRLSFAPFEKNYQDYGKVVEYAKQEFGITDVGICYPTSSTKFGENLVWPEMDTDTFNKFYEKYVIDKCKGGWKYACQYFHWHVKQRKLMPCWGAQTIVNILPSGEVSPCCFREDGIIGQVTDDRVEFYPEKRKKVIQGIKKGYCIYRNDRVCGDCHLVHTSRRQAFKLMWWKLFHWGN